LVGNLNEELKQDQEEVKHIDCKSRVLAFCHFYVAPFENDVKNLLQIFRLGIDHSAEGSYHLKMLFEVSAEHVLHKFISENLFAQMLHFFDLLGFQLFVHPFNFCVDLGSLLLAARVHNKNFFFISDHCLSRSSNRLGGRSLCERATCGSLSHLFLR
jgi:hypothetical protein